ncbi:MAG: glycosyltransferase family 4 protein [Geminicoccaceae bacterium]
MRIGQIAPLAESVPPQLYGGTERVVAWLTDALVDLGHEVTLFASGDSKTSARLVACASEALRLDPAASDPLPHAVLQMETVRQAANRFDLLHFHIDHVHLPLIRSLPCPTVTTLHGRLDLPDLQPLFREFPDVPLVSISDAQRRPMPPVNWLGTVHHGLPRDLFHAELQPRGGYLAFLGRISAEKRPDLAIEIAIQAGLPLKIFAKVDEADEGYYRSTIEPLLDHPLVEFVGEIGDEAKQRALGNALAVLFPIDWPEPFGLIMIEAMACGTPVVAFPHGSVPEILEDGLTGFIVDSPQEAVAAVGRLDSLKREAIRRQFEARFTAERMAHDYAQLYRRLSTGERSLKIAPASVRPLTAPLDLNPAQGGTGPRLRGSTIPPSNLER